MTQKRKSRELETRDAGQRVMNWEQPGLLQAPDPPLGWRYKWVRCIIEGNTDTLNLNKAFRQGFQPVQAEELKDSWLYDTAEDGDLAGVVREGDCILCKIPEELAKQRTAHFDGLADRMQQAVDQQLMKDNSRKMPITNDSEQHVKKGRQSFQD